MRHYELSGHNRRGEQFSRMPIIRCDRHPGVVMVLAGRNTEWQTIRYICPLCQALLRPPLEVAEGVITAYWPRRGYGFVEHSGPPIFFHISQVSPGLRPLRGARVQCIVDETAKGLAARHVWPA